MPEKDEEVRVRLTKEEKEEWNKFVKESKDFENLSQLIRYSVRGVILGDLIEKKSNSQNGVKKESEIDGMIDLLKEMKDLKKTQESQSEQLHIISSYILNGEKTFSNEPRISVERPVIEDEIIDLLKSKPLTSEELAEHFNMPEHRILRFLNPMVERYFLKLNDKMEYYISDTSPYDEVE